MVKKCEHCLDEKYVFEYWLENLLKERDIHLTSIPSEIFKQIPVEFLYPCHCNKEIFLRSLERKDLCSECNGTTWQLTEEAKLNFGHLKKITDFSPQELEALACDFLYRCPCGLDEQAPKHPKRDFQRLRDILEKLSVPLLLPRVRFS